MGAVKRAKALQARGAMRSKLGPVSVEIEAASADDVTLQAVRGGGGVGCDWEIDV